MEKEKYYICYFLYYADINKKTTNWTFQNECTLAVCTVLYYFDYNIDNLTALIYKMRYIKQI